MQTSIATVSFSGGLSEKLEAISAAKFDAVEIFETTSLPSAAASNARRVVEPMIGRHEHQHRMPAIGNGG